MPVKNKGENGKKIKVVPVRKDSKPVPLTIPLPRGARHKTRAKLKAAIKSKYPRYWNKLSTLEKKAWRAKQIIREANNLQDRGRVSGYRREFDLRVFKYCLLGLTDKEIAPLLDTDEDTLGLWKREHPKFLSAFQRGREDADADVAFGMYNRARGMTIPDTYFATYFGRIISKSIVKHLPPDPKAAAIWLHNRRSQDWRQRQIAPGSEEDANVPPPTRVEIIVKDARRGSRE